MGVKALANYMNSRGILRRGRHFGAGRVHDLLKISTYCGRHYFNRVDSRNGKMRPPSQWIEHSVPAIIDADTFSREWLPPRAS